MRIKFHLRKVLSECISSMSRRKVWIIDYLLICHIHFSSQLHLLTRLAIFITFNKLSRMHAGKEKRRQERERENLNAFKLLPKSSSSPPLSSSSTCAIIHLFVFIYYQSFNTNNHIAHIARIQEKSSSGRMFVVGK